MKLIGGYIEKDLADRFTALARAHGGKSALLRRLVSLAVNGPAAEQSNVMPDPSGRAVHLSVRLSANEVGEVKKAAKARGMKPSQWLRSVVRVRLGAGTQYNAAELHELRALTNQVRKIGINLNQVTRAMNEARLKQVPFDVDVKLLNATREEVRKTLAELQSMARGNVRNWNGAVDGE